MILVEFVVMLERENEKLMVLMEERKKRQEEGRW